MAGTSGKYYYAKNNWDVDAWIDVIHVDYETLIQHYAFDETFQSFSEKGAISLLDVGCGNAIFPSFLDKILSEDVRITCDLLDISDTSLSIASRVLDKSVHFSGNRLIRSLIEDIPVTLSRFQNTYDVIWAIHSLTTVDVEQMPAVFTQLLDALTPDGYFYIYQFTARSAYQQLHRHYLAHHPNRMHNRPYMEFEDTIKILESLDARYKVHELFFHHELSDHRIELIEKYLQKCVLDDKIDAWALFEGILENYHDRSGQRFLIPQYVNLVEIRKGKA